MQLQLIYNQHTQLAPRAVIVKGDTPSIWLNVINTWNIPLLQLECYILPESVYSIAASGLLVIFPTENLAKNIEYHQAYGILNNQLLIPINTSLTPAITVVDLQKTLLYPRQIFHPIIGLVGFEKDDRLDWGKLLEFNNNTSTNWSFAKKGNPPFAKLRSIRVHQPSLDDVMQSFKDMIDQKPLEDLMDEQTEGGDSSLSDAFSKFGLNMLKGGLGALQNLGQGLDGGEGDSSSGMMDRLQDWVNKNLEELERRRKKELDRLSDLFDKDVDEALKYAIPLDSPYLNRGSASTPSWRLGRRDTDFSLGGLGGGRAVDGWDMDHNRYMELRKKYLEAANKQLELKNYKKAAYIFANLLGDFSSAANALKQGKFYREAAALYKDHLKNIGMAAQCLEQGGLILEAIDLYIEMERHEKVGDLYVKLEQYNRAAEQYETCVDLAMKRNDVVDAVRILEKKLNRPKRALTTAFNGWVKSIQPERSLDLYFDLIAKNNIDLNPQIKSIFENHTPIGRRNSFLNILMKLNNKHTDKEIGATTKDIAYQIVSNQATQQNNFENLYRLKNFLTNDRLLNSDISRFVTPKKSNPRRSQLGELQLDKNIRWFSAINYHHQFLALGVSPRNELHLARGNWKGDIEYYAWSQEIHPNDDFRLIADDRYSSYVILHHVNGHKHFATKQLNPSIYFKKGVKIISPKILNSPHAIGWKKNGNIATINFTNQSAQLNEYTTNDILFRSDNLDFLGIPDNFSEIKFRDNFFHFNFYGNILLAVSQIPGLDKLPFQGVKLFDISSYFHPTKIAVATADEVIIYYKDSNNQPVYFTHQFEAIGLKFIGEDHLVAIGRYQLVVFDIRGKHPQLKWEKDSDQNLVSVLSVSRRERFGVLDEYGKMREMNID